MDDILSVESDISNKTAIFTMLDVYDQDKQGSMSHLYDSRYLMPCPRATPTSYGKVTFKATVMEHEDQSAHAVFTVPMTRDSTTVDLNNQVLGLCELQQEEKSSSSAIDSSPSPLPLQINVNPKENSNMPYDQISAKESTLPTIPTVIIDDCSECQSDSIPQQVQTGGKMTTNSNPENGTSLHATMGKGRWSSKVEKRLKIMAVIHQEHQVSSLTNIDC